MANRASIPVFRSAFNSPQDEFDSNLGIRPVVFDILAPDLETSILPEGIKMVLHINPTSISFSYSKAIERIQTKGGYVEQHWGEGARSINFSIATGGFKRLYSGLSNITGGGQDTLGTRRETIAYDKYLDLLALFHNNGSVFDSNGEIAFQGIIKMTFDGGIYLGWFSTFNVEESADKPYMFDLSAEFIVSHEILRLRSMPFLSAQTVSQSSRVQNTLAINTRRDTNLTTQDFDFDGIDFVKRSRGQSIRGPEFPKTEED